MRTTIDIPDQLLRRAKAEAALQGRRFNDVVRDALQRHQTDAGRVIEPSGAPAPGVQELGDGCIFPLITGTTAPFLRELGGANAQRLLDEEDVDRKAHSR